MKTFAKIGLAAIALAGSALTLAAPADARVSIGIGIGVPGPVVAPPPPPPGYGPPPPAYGPPPPGYAPGYYPTYGYPIFIDGAWVTGPHYFRDWHGHREVWFQGHWRGDFHRR